MSDKIIRSETFVNYETGEVKTVEKQATIKSQEPDYVKLYVKAWCAFRDVRNVNMSLLTALLPYMSYAKDGQKIFLNSMLKREIAKELGWSEKTAIQRFDVELTRLKKANVVRPIGRGSYQINPELFGKGEWKDISKLVVSFHLSDGTIDIKEEEKSLFDYSTLKIV